ncbi:hypothetical protein SAMN04487913_12724 [Arthrobacter sp. ok362]|nr:hypothetical protein SAMN04487913_12724 [Arthrobacter sp. ok362]
MAEMPPATVEVSNAVVQRLVRDQRPDLRDRPLVRVANGWDNATFRLGDAWPSGCRAGRRPFR